LFTFYPHTGWQKRLSSVPETVNIVTYFVLRATAVSGNDYIYIYYEIVHKVHNKKKMKKRQGKNKNTK